MESPATARRGGTSSTPVSPPEQPKPGPSIVTRDDVVEIRFRGTFDEEQVHEVFAAVDAARARHPRVFVLAEGGGSTTPAARKVIGEWFRASPTPLEVAVWNQSAIARAVSEMLIRAINLLHPGRFLVRFFRTREDACGWIDAQRGAPTHAP